MSYFSGNYCNYNINCKVSIQIDFSDNIDFAQSLKFYLCTYILIIHKAHTIDNRQNKFELHKIQKKGSWLGYHFNFPSNVIYCILSCKRLYQDIVQLKIPFFIVIN